MQGFFELLLQYYERVSLLFVLYTYSYDDSANDCLLDITAYDTHMFLFCGSILFIFTHHFSESETEPSNYQCRYYSPAEGRFLNVTQCNTTFPVVGQEVEDDDGGAPSPPPASAFEPAYAFRVHTSTSDNLCSVCSRCAAGYVVSCCVVDFVILGASFTLHL